MPRLPDGQLPVELRHAVSLRNRAARTGRCDECGARKRMITIDGLPQIRVAHQGGCPASSAAIFAMLRAWEPAA